MGVCPFHNDKGPSLSVSGEKGLFHCFGCGKSGTAITFLMEYESLSFPEALERLARETGIALNVKENDDNDRLKKVNNIAMDYFYQNLMFSDLGKDARMYLSGRKITKETIETFRLGFAPDGWQGFTDYAKSKKIALSDAEILGLVKTNNGSTYDVFRNRLMFPILDSSGNAIAFGGRTLDDAQQPKYLNSSETPLFKKSNVLYGYHASRQEINRRKEAILVEGYMDLLSMVQHGVVNVAAVLGTAFTEYHVKLLVNRAETVYLFFDSDEAGVRAALRSLEILFKSPISSYVITNPHGKDPDDLMRSEGKVAFDDLKAAAKTGFDFFIERHIDQKDFENPQKKAIAYKKLEEYFGTISDESLRLMYMQQLDRRFGVIRRRASSVTSKDSTDTIKNVTYDRNDIFIIMFVLESSSYAREIFEREEKVKFYVKSQEIYNELIELYKLYKNGENLFVKGNTIFISNRNIASAITMYITKNSIQLTKQQFEIILRYLDSDFIKKKIELEKYSQKGGVV